MTDPHPHNDRILHALALATALYAALLALGGAQHAQAIAGLFTALLPYTERQP